MIYNVVILYISFSKNLLNAYYTRQAGAKVKKKKTNCLPLGFTVQSAEKFPGSDMYSYSLNHLFYRIFFRKMEFSLLLI